MIPGSANCSNLSAPISLIHNKLQDFLLLTQQKLIDVFKFNVVGTALSGLIYTSHISDNYGTCTLENLPISNTEKY